MYENRLDESLLGEKDSRNGNSTENQNICSSTNVDNIDDNNNTNNDNNNNIYGYFALPFSEQTYYCNRALENIHIYLWITKDLAWMQDWEYPSLAFGSFALFWCLILFYQAIFIMKNWLEFYMLIPMSMWLAANFIWMQGEVLNDDDSIVAPVTEHIMISAMGLIVIYYTILKPFRIIPYSKTYTEKYENPKLIPRFHYFNDWREYEYLHALFWLGKDFCWVSNYPIPWIIFLTLTILLSIDFIYTTRKTNMMAIDVAHYIAQLIWILGNAVWALGAEFVIPKNDDDTVYTIDESSHTARSKCRWWASVILICAYLPILALYCIWYPLTCMNVIKAADITQNNHIITKYQNTPLPISNNSNISTISEVTSNLQKEHIIID